MNDLATRTAPDEQKMNAFVGRMLGDMGAAFSGALIMIGDKLGLYRAMAGAGPIGPQQLASAPARTSAMSANG